LKYHHEPRKDVSLRLIESSKFSATIFYSICQELTTVEGVLDRIISSLESDIELRKETDKETAEKLKEFVQKMTDLKNLKMGKFDLVSFS